MTQDSIRDTRLITRVVLRNYKSIAGCDVQLEPLTFLVGPNASGKSNFLDALGFVSEALQRSLDHALRSRGGIAEVRRRSGGHPNHFGVRLELSLADADAAYSFNIRAVKDGGYAVKQEECSVVPRSDPTSKHWFRVNDGIPKGSIDALPPAAHDRLYLVNASGRPEFRPVYDALSTMGFYNLSPDAIRELQTPDPGEQLQRDGGNLASVLANISRRTPETKARISEYLSSIVPGLSDVEQVSLGPRETLQFRQEVSGASTPWRFHAESMSDGTLRTLGVLVALFQAEGLNASTRRLIGIEEPEIALHPGAAGILTDALRDASSRTQILVTSHSPELLDNAEISEHSILAVVSEHGETRIGPLDEAGRSTLRDHLFTAGELLRMDQLRPAPEAAQADQLELFESGSKP